jgi:signal peptidase I
MQGMDPERVVRRGSWVTLGVAGLYGIGMLVNPVAGAAVALLFLAFGWGIRQRQAWAATGAAVFLIAPAFLLVGRMPMGLGLAAALAFQLGIAWLPAAAAVALWRHREMARFGAGWLVAAVAVIVAAVFLRPYATPTDSMANTLDRGDYFLTESVSWRFGRAPRVGDLVQVRYPIDPKTTFVKRVVGVPGDRLRFVNKQLWRNGALVDEPYVTHRTSYIDDFRDNFPAAPATIPLPALAVEMLARDVRNGELIVPEGRYFVLGDSRDNSLDSRYWGFVTRDQILGSPLVIYASYDVPEAAPQVTETIFSTRWKRLLKVL